MPEAEKLFRIRVKNCPVVKCCPGLRKFAGMVRIATMAGGLFLFTFTYSTGLTGIAKESYAIASNLVDILS